MRVLITGSAGFIGSHVVDHFLANTDWDIIGIDSFRHRGDSLRVQSDPRYKIYCHDLNAPISYRLAQKIGDVDAIINMASESHVDRSIEEPADFIRNNVNVSLNTLDYAITTRIKQYIQISTDEVYGAAPEGLNHKEWSPILPSNPYAASKAAQEAIAISYWRTYGLPLVITNTMNNFGSKQDKEKFIPMLISKIESGQEVTIHGTERYIGKRHYLHARNHADALMWLIKNIHPISYQDTSGDIIFPSRYNVVGEAEVDNLELANIISKILRRPLLYKFVDFHAARPGHDRRYSLDGTKLKDLGWKAPVAFFESLKKTVEWTLENREWL